MGQSATAVVDDEYGLEPAKPAAGGVTDNQYGLEPATPTPKTAKPVAPTRKPGEAKLLTQEEVDKFQPPTKFEQGHEGPHTPMLAPLPGMGITDVEPIVRGAKTFASDIPKMALGALQQTAEQLPGGRAAESIAHGNFAEVPSDLLDPAKQARDNLQAVHESDMQRKEAGRSLPYRVLAGGAQATGVADPTGMEAEAERGNTAGVMGHAAAQAAPVVLAEAARTPAGRRVVGAAGDLATKAGEKVAEMRAPGRISNFDSVVRDLAGKTPADLEFTKTLDKVRPDIAKIARESGFEEKGNARVGEFEQMLGERERQIWSQEHIPQIKAQGHLAFDADAPAQKATASLSKQMRADNPAAARAVDRWVASTLNPDVIGTVEGADKLMRSLNAANPDVPEPFKNLMRIAKNAAGDAIREQLEVKLQDAGEAGVSNPNGRWGGLREIRTAIQDRLNNAANKPLSWWDTLRSARTPMVEGAIAGGALGALGGEGPAGIGAGVGAATGAVGSVIHDVLAEPGGRIARAMKGLGKTNLQPNEVQPGIPRLPYRAGPDTSGPITGRAPGETPRWSDTAPLPTPQRDTVGVLPGLSGPVTAPMWGRPVVQAQPGFELPNQELMGPWGNGVAPDEPPQTVAPMKPPMDFPPKPGVQEPLDFTKPVPEPEQKVPRGTSVEQPVKPMEKPAHKLSEKAELMGAKRQGLGPEFETDQVTHEIERNQAIIDSDKATEQDKADARDRLRDAKHLQENLEKTGRVVPEGEQKPVETREDRRAKGRADILPGMEEHVAKQAEGAAKVQGEKLAEEINTPKNVDEAAGHIESRGPLFRAAGAGPQNEMFKANGEAVAPMKPPAELAPGTKVLHKFPGEEGTQAEVAKIDKGFSVGLRDTDANEMVGLTKIYPTEEEAVAAAKALAAGEEAKPTEIKGITAKEPKTAKTKAMKPVPVEKRYGADEILDAEGLLHQEAGMMTGGDRPDIYYDEHTDETRPLTQNQDFRHGERAGGKWRGVGSGRDMQPFMREHPEWGPEYIKKALRNKDSAAYQKVMNAAIDFVRREKMTPEEKAALREETEKQRKAEADEAFRAAEERGEAARRGNPMRLKKTPQ